jgi:hypothetical protein
MKPTRRYAPHFDGLEDRTFLSVGPGPVAGHWAAVHSQIQASLALRGTIVGTFGPTEAFLGGDVVNGAASINGLRASTATGAFSGFQGGRGVLVQGLIGLTDAQGGSALLTFNGRLATRFLKDPTLLRVRASSAMGDLSTLAGQGKAALRFLTLNPDLTGTFRLTFNLNAPRLSAR